LQKKILKILKKYLQFEKDLCIIERSWQRKCTAYCLPWHRAMKRKVAFCELQRIKR